MWDVPWTITCLETDDLPPYEIVDLTRPYQKPENTGTMLKPQGKITAIGAMMVRPATLEIMAELELIELTEESRLKQALLNFDVMSFHSRLAFWDLSYARPYLTASYLHCGLPPNLRIGEISLQSLVMGALNALGYYPDNYTQENVAGIIIPGSQYGGSPLDRARFLHKILKALQDLPPKHFD